MFSETELICTKFIVKVARRCGIKWSLLDEYGLVYIRHSARFQASAVK